MAVPCFVLNSTSIIAQRVQLKHANPVETYSEEKLLRKFRITRGEVIKDICTSVNEDLITTGLRKCDIS